MSDIEKIMEMAFCSREDAESALKKMGNVFEAVCLLMEAPAPKKERSEQQKFFDDTRQALAELEKNNAEVLNANRLSGLAPDETQTLPEETSLQNNCSPECQPRAQESEEQKQETDGP
jgi:hypothetical protein